MKLKRVLSLLVALAMIMSLSVSAFATETGTVALETSENAFDSDAHDSQMVRKEVMVLSVGDSAQMIGNDYIQFYVADASDSENKGRFTIGNTEGNPNYSSDDDKILLFGHPNPWSSYTTIRINSTNYIFKADKTTYNSDELKAVSTMTVENVLITQTLQIVKNDGTGLKDTVQISYTAENQSNTAKNIAIRIMLDTMLGSNDGAPFKVPSLGNVVSERELSGNAIPSYWQSFDSLTDASVFAVGTLYKGTDRKPDKVQFTAWGNVYSSSNVWNYTIDTDNAVTGDSAVSIYWNPVSVAAGSSTNVTTYYGVGYANSGSSSTVTSAEIPSQGFGVQIVDESGEPVEGATVEAANATGHPTKTTGSDGLAIFNTVPQGNGNTRKVQLTVTKDGYQKITLAERYVDKGGLTAVTIYLDDGKAHISSAMGQIDGTTVDLISNYKYFKANSSDTKEADDRSNVKDFTINVTASGGDKIDRYQILQGGSIVAESNTSTITIPVLTGTPTNVNSFGSDWRITKLKAGEIVYLRVVDVNGVASEKKPLGIKVSEPTLYGSGDSKGTLNFGENLTINVPSSIPIIGDSEIKLGWNGLPFQFEVSENGKVKFAINPPDDELYKEEDWENFKEDYDFAKEMQSFSSKPLTYGAGKISVKANVMGYGEGYIDDNGNVIVDVGIIITISEKGSYTWTYFLGYVPVYVSIGEKVSWTGSGQISVTRTNGTWKVTGAVSEINKPPIIPAKITLNVDGGVGANGILNIGASGRATLSWLNRWTDNYNRVDLTGEMYLVAQAFLFKAEKKLASGTWTIYDSYSSRSLDTQAEALNYDLYDSSAYSPIDRDYLNTPMLLSGDPDVVKANIYPYASPKMVKAGSTYYLFWLDDVTTRAANDRTALMYATSEDCATWSTPVQVIPEGEGGTADFAYDVYADGNNIHIALSKANKTFGSTATTLDEMAAFADIYYVKLNTSNGEATEPQRITDNAYADTTPVIVANGSQVMVAYVENKLEGGLFGTDNSYSVCYQTIDGQAPTAISITGLVTELDAGILNGKSTISYVVDTDKDYNTDADTELWVVSAGEDSRKLDSTSIHSPSFSTKGLLWYSNGSISFNNGTSTTNVFGDEQPVSLSRSFYVIEGDNGNIKVVWSAMSEDEETDTTAVYAVDYSGSVWSNAYVMFETGSELTSVLGGYSNGTTDYIAHIRTTGISGTESASLCVEVATAPTDIAILSVDYKMNDVQPDAALPMTLAIQNCGATKVNSISVNVGDDTIATISDANLERGETKAYEISGFTVPSDLSDVATKSLSIAADNDSNSKNNSVDFELGYTDVSVTASPLLVNGKNWASVTVTNDSHIATDVTLRIIADEKDGAVLLEKKLTGLERENSQAILLDLDSIGANVSVFYVTVTADKDEIATADNEDLIYLALGRTTKYTLTVSASTGGTIVGNSGGLYTEGESISISALADDGYKFAGWTSSNGGNFGDASDANTTFVMPANDVTVTATFISVGSQDSGGSRPSLPGGSTSPSKPIVPDGSWKNPFTDVASGAWYFAAVKFVSENNLMQGVGNGKFAPNVNLSRSMLAQILYNKEGKPNVNGTSAFTDVAATAWYANAVTWAAEKGIVNGYGNDLFGPEDNITREQLVTIIWRYEGSPAATIGSLNFTDADEVSSWANEAVRWAVENGIINGKGDGILDPAGEATRAEVAQMLKNYLEK